MTGDVDTLLGNSAGAGSGGTVPAHSPLPWQFVVRGRRGMVIDANDKTVLHCPEEYTALDRANLELIVVSVNGSWVRAMNAVGYGTNGADEEGGA